MLNKVYQDHSQGCVSACVATIFNQKIEDVPDMWYPGNSQLLRLNNYVKQFGKIAVMAQNGSYIPGEYHIKSLQAYTHMGECPSPHAYV